MIVGSIAVLSLLRHTSDLSRPPPLNAIMSAIRNGGEVLGLPAKTHEDKLDMLSGDKLHALLEDVGSVWVSSACQHFLVKLVGH